MAADDSPAIPVSTDADIDAVLPAALAQVRKAYDAPDEVFDRSMALFHALEPLRRGDPTLVEGRMLALSTDPRWEARALASEVLRHLTATLRKRPVPRALERACLLVAMASVETDARALSAELCAFVDLKGSIDHALVVTFALRFVAHPDPDIRYGAAAVLCGIESNAAVEALIVLSRDPDESVRDWACFALGRGLGFSRSEQLFDTAELRDALAARLDDPSIDAREEAATGLALRGDERGLSAIERSLARFEDDGVSERILLQIRETPDRRFTSALEVIVDALPESKSAREALAACCS